ncbi:MAG: DUF3078 domain-containing protein [Dysgonamonadaceae bacterium]|nr:DUF3078 domain-containing protein [Dysgonamonadaceae bacterium]
MKQFTQLLFLALLSSTLHLSASHVNKNDTIGKFDEITDIELLLRSLQDTTETSISNEVVTADTIRIKMDSVVSVMDTIIDSVKVDSLSKDSVVLPKKKLAFKPIVIKTSLDSLYQRKSNGIIKYPLHSDAIYSYYANHLNFADTMLYNQMYLPVVFTGRIEMPDSAFVLYPKEDSKLKVNLISPDKTFMPLLEQQAFVDKVRRDYYIENPTLIKISRSELGSVKHTATDTEVREKFNPFKELLSSQASFSLEKPAVEGTKIKRVYWIKSGENSLQFSQNYFSPNWHTRGTSNLNINSYHVFRVNYVKEKVKFNNMFEWRLSLFNAPDDTLRSYRIGNDLLRYYGDFGLDVDSKKRWSYSTNLEAKSQIFTRHIANKTDLQSAFLAPLYVNAGIGMKYNLNRPSKSVRHRRVVLAVAISPLSLNYKYVGNSDVNVKRYGIPEGKKYILDKGSSVNSQLTYTITKYVSWVSRIKYFTNYSKVEAEFENTLNMSLSQAFSTRLYLHLRFDDGVPADPDYKYLQVNEVLSFGLNFKW